MYLRRDSLQRLIASLSASEKRGVTLFLKSLPQRDHTVYLQLLERIKDASALSDFKSRQTKTKAKKRLYGNIMKSLRNHHDSKSADIIIQNLLCEIEILYDLSLADDALVILKKAYRYAEKFEKHGMLLQIFEWERKLNIVLDQPDRNNDAIEKEQETTLEALNKILQYKNVFSRVKEMKKKYGYVKNLSGEEAAMKQLISSLPPMRASDPQKAHYYYNFTMSVFHWMRFRHQKAYTYSKELLSDEIQRILPNEFVEGVFEHITSCVCIGKFEEALSCMAVADQFIIDQKFNQSNTFLLRTFYFKIIYKLLIYYYMGDLEQLSLTVGEAREKLGLFDKQLSVEMKEVIYANLRNAYMVLGQGKRSERIITETIRKGPAVVRKDLYDDALLFRMFALLQTKTYAPLPSIAQSARRYYRQSVKDAGVPDTAEYQIAALLQKEHHFEDETIKNAVLTEIKNILTTQISSLKGINNFQEFYTYFLVWVKSMLHEQPFHKEMKTWYVSFSKQRKQPPEQPSC